MTLFSTIFSEHVKRKNIKTYPMAQYCGVDRSNMYKLISGKRNPNSKKLVNKIADFMRLTPSERKELLEAYKITITGQEIYYRRKNVQNFISNFSNHAEDIPDMSTYFSTNFDHVNSINEFPLSGKTKLNHTIYKILAWESQKEHGDIKLLFQPDTDDFMEMLTAISKNKTNLKIDHILCLNNTDNITFDKRNYNLCCLQRIIPMYYSCLCQYTPLCYYDSINSHNSNFNLLSSLIITSEYVINFSPQLQYGILFTQENTLQKFHTIFEDLKAETTPIVCKIDSIFSQYEYFNSLDVAEKTGFSFQKEPCLIPMMPLSFPEKYLIRDLPDRDIFLPSAKQYIQQTRETLKSATTTFIFSEDGIKNFLQTGKIFELPDSIYTPIEYKDRLLIIHNLVNACQSQKYRMLHSDSPLVSSNLCIYVTAHNGYLLFSSADGNLVYLNLEEPSLLLAFYDYLSSLDDELFYTTEEALSILKQMLKK